jgi:hypothetical protein
VQAFLARHRNHALCVVDWDLLDAYLDELRDDGDLLHTPGGAVGRCAFVDTQKRSAHPPWMNLNNPRERLHASFIAIFSITFGLLIAWSAVR